MSETRILVVDDEPGIRRYIRASLEQGGFKVLLAVDGVEALATFETEMPSLVVLDLLMPNMDGYEVCRRIREWSNVPIIMLSAIDSVADKAKCLDLGADDYLTKPFGPPELMARVNAVLRRTGSETVRPLFSCGELEIDFAARRVMVKGEKVILTPTEYGILRELVLQADKTLTHTHLLKRVWGDEYGDERESLRVLVGRLRVKIEADPATPKRIVNVYNVGYMFSTE